MSQTLGDESEVVFDQPEERAGAMEPDGSIPNRRKEEEWLVRTHISYIHQFVAGSEGFCQMNYICMSHEEHKSRRPAWL